MEEFNIASMEENSLQKIFFIKFNWKVNIGLERGGQAHFSIITYIILIQLYHTKYNIVIYLWGFWVNIDNFSDLLSWQNPLNETFQMKLAFIDLINTKLYLITDQFLINESNNHLQGLYNRPIGIYAKNF